MPNPYYFTDRALQVGLSTYLDSHKINHATSNLTNKPKFPELGVKTRYFNEILKEIAFIYARLMNQIKLKYQTCFSERLDQQNEDNQILDQTDLFITLNIIQNLTEPGNDKIDIKSPIEQQIQNQELRDSGKRFDKII